MKRSATKSEREHMRRVSEMGCICCEICYGWEGSSAEVHHVRVRHGWGRSSHKATIPLCEPHHEGAMGVHTLGRGEFKDTHGYSEIELLDIVNKRLGVES